MPDPLSKSGRGPLKLFLVGLIAIVVGLPCWLFAAASGLDPHGPHPAWEEPLFVAGGAAAFFIGPIAVGSAIIWYVVRRFRKR